MTATIEAKVRELVAEIVQRTEAHVEAIFADAIASELELRRNGGAPTVEISAEDSIDSGRDTSRPATTEPPIATTKRCRRCDCLEGR